MKRVLMVADRGLGRAGIPAVMMAIIRGLKDEYQFDLVLFTDEVRYYDAEVLSYGAKIFRIPFYQGRNPIRRRLDYYVRGGKLYRQIRKILQENGPYDVIHCHNFYESALCVKAAHEAGVPVRITHNHTCLKIDSAIRDLIDDRYMELIRKFATHKIACSEEAGRTMFGNDSEVLAVYNAYDETRFDPECYPVQKPDKLAITQIGSFSDNKNQLFTLEVLRTILDRGIPAEVNFVGFGDYKAVVEKKADALGLTEYVKFQAADADTPALLSRSAACMFPSVKEGFGIVLVEAQAMGVRCYVSDSIPRDADAGGCTFLPLSAGAQAWADKIISDYERTGGTHGQFDCSAFSTETIMKTYRAIYRGEQG